MNKIIAPNRNMVSGSQILANAALLVPAPRAQWGKIPKHVQHNLIASRAREERAAIVAESKARMAAHRIK